MVTTTCCNPAASQIQHGASAPSFSLEKYLQPHQQRVVAEKDQLAERLGKLLIFSQGQMFPTLPEAEQTRLSCQALFMDGYLKVLEQRVEAFKQDTQRKFAFEQGLNGTSAADLAHVHVPDEESGWTD